MNWIETYVEALRATGLEAESRKAAGVSKRVVANQLEIDPDFAAAVEDATEMWADLLEKEAFRRAVTGIEKGVYYQGEKVDSELQYSDTLLSQMLKAYRKDRYAPELTLKGTGKGGSLTVVVREFSDEDDLA